METRPDRGPVTLPFIAMKPMMKGLAIYTAVALGGFAIYSVYYAVAGDNSPFWITLAIGCLPAVAFASIYLARKH